MSAPTRPGLSSLASVELPPHRQAFLDELRSQGPASGQASGQGAGSGPGSGPGPGPGIGPGIGIGIGQGSAEFRARKLAELRDLFALETVAPRLDVLAVDASTELKAIVGMAVPTPCFEDDALVVRPAVVLALRYPEEILRGPLPGYALVQVVQPRAVWHSNVSADPAQRLCLGANVPKGLPLREAVLGSYAALTLQSITLDGADPAGVMNRDALLWWNDHVDRIPLSREAFLDVPGSAEELPLATGGTP